MFASSPLGATLPASDIERAKTFYREKLGLEPIEEPSEGAAMYETGGTRFLLYQSTFAGTNQATAAAWEVEDIAAVVGELKSRGVEFQEFEMEGMDMHDSVLTDPDGTKAAWFYDSERNIIGVVQTAS